MSVNETLPLETVWVRVPPRAEDPVDERVTVVVLFVVMTLPPASRI